MSPPSFEYEKRIKNRGFKLIAGVDEAGRGPLAGPVVAAAVIFTSTKKIKGLKDSKKLSPSTRERLYQEILDIATSVGVGIVSEQVIDEFNILNATLLAMHEAIQRLSATPDHILIDGKKILQWLAITQTAVPYGDNISATIAAASIVAKVTRDRIMNRLSNIYPGYGFSRHKGYGTAEHIKILKRRGPLPIHRKTFQPVFGLLGGKERLYKAPNPLTGLTYLEKGW